jgi:hypothetical protein
VKKTDKKSIGAKYRVLYILVLFGIFFFLNYFSCLKLNLSTFPIKDNDGKKFQGVVFLFDPNICNICPNGVLLSSLKEKTDVLFIVSPDFTDSEITNLKNVFQIRGPVIKGNEKTVSVLKQLAQCSRQKDWKQNFFVRLNQERKIDSIRSF